jgi:hypothetical protein
MSDRFVAVNRPRVSLNTAAVLDTETNLWTAFIDDTGAVKAAEYLNGGDMAPEDYVGWRADSPEWSSIGTDLEQS